MNQIEWANYLVRNRMDPTKAKYRMGWSPRRPRPFWLDPTTQTVNIGDDRVWTHIPIHDPVWWMT